MKEQSKVAFFAKYNNNNNNKTYKVLSQTIYVYMSLHWDTCNVYYVHDEYMTKKKSVLITKKAAAAAIKEYE